MRRWVSRRQNRGRARTIIDEVILSESRNTATLSLAISSTQTASGKVRSSRVHGSRFTTDISHSFCIVECAVKISVPGLSEGIQYFLGLALPFYGFLMASFTCDTSGAFCSALFNLTRCIEHHSGLSDLI